MTTSSGSRFLKAGEGTGLPRIVYLVTNRRLCRDQGQTLVKVTKQALAAGLVAVQLREKDLPGGKLYRLALQLRQLAHEYNTLFLVNDRVDIALAVGADGVHLGQKSLPPPVARELLGSEKVIGVSVHSLAEARAAAAAGADYLLAGHVFATPSKPGVAGRGTGFVREIAAAVGIPVVAIGGISNTNVVQLENSGVAAVAVMSAVMGAKDPALEVSKLQLAGEGFFKGLECLRKGSTLETRGCKITSQQKGGSL